MGCGQLHPFPDCYRKSRDTGTVGIPEHCVFGGVHRPRKRFAQVDLDISSATAGKDVSRALHARERLLQLSFSGIGHIRQRPLAVGDEDDWSGANRHRGLSRDRLPTEGIGSSEVEVYDVGRARNPPPKQLGHLGRERLLLLPICFAQHCNRLKLLLFQA